MKILIGITALKNNNKPEIVDQCNNFIMYLMKEKLRFNPPTEDTL